MKRMDLYLARTVIVNVLLVALVLTALASLITFVGEFRSVGGTYTLLEAARYTLFKVPGELYDMFPVAALLGALLGLGELASHNELTVLRVAGVSVTRLGMAAVFGGLLLSLASALLGEFVVPQTEQQAEDRRNELLNARSPFGTGGVWAKDGKLFVNIHGMHGADTATGVNLYEVDADHRLLQAYSARTAVFLGGGRAELDKVRGTRFAEDGDRARIFHEAKREWDTLLEPSLINLFAVDTDSLSAHELYRYIQYQHANRLDARRFVAAFWGRVAKPVSLLVMMLLALPFVFGPLRSSSTGQRLLVGMLIGIGFYVFNSMFMQTGVVFGVNPVVTAWLPTVLLGAISVAGLRSIR